MVFAVFFVALLCGAYANPLGQTTVCESAANIPLFAPTVCDYPYPYLPFYPYQYKQVCETTPNLLPYAIPLPVPYSSTVCETQNPVPIWTGLPLPLPNITPDPPSIVCQTVPTVGSTTVCETAPVATPNFFYPYPGVLPNVGTTTCCETTPNVLPYPYPGIFPSLPPYLPSAFL